MRPIVSRDDRRTTRRTDAERLGERQERVVPWGLSGTCTQAQRGSHRDKQVRISPCANHIRRVARPGSVRKAILGRTIEAGRAIGVAKSATEAAGDGMTRWLKDGPDRLGSSGDGRAAGAMCLPWWQGGELLCSSVANIFR